MAETDAEKRPLQIAYPAADGGLLRDQPRTGLDIPHIHRPTHHPQHVVAFKRRDRPAAIKLDRIPVDAVRFEEFAEDAWVFAIQVLEDEEAHVPTTLPPSAGPA